MVNHDERATAIWRAKLVLLFVGVPGVILAVASLSFNILFARQLGHDDADKIVLTAVALAVSLLISGLPIAIDLLRRGDLRTVAVGLWVACFAFSMVSAMGFSTGSRSRVAAETDAAMNDRTAVERSIARGEAELTALPSHRPASTIQGEIRVTEAATGINCAKARSRNSRNLCAPVFALQSELAAAHDAERIEARLAAQRQQLAGMTVYGSSDAQADVLSWLGAGVLSADAWRKIMGLFTAALVEFGAAGCLLITGKSVAALLASEPVPVTAPVVVEEISTPEVLEPSPLAAVEPELGWQMWFQSCVTAQRGGKITPKDAYAHYERWASLNNVVGVLPYIAFGKRMNEAVSALGGKIGRSSKERHYADVSLTKLGSNGVPLIEDREAGE